MNEQNEQKDMSGVLFKEAKLNMDYSGSCLIDGKAYWINAWLRDGRTGTKYLGLRFKSKDKPEAIAENPPF